MDDSFPLPEAGPQHWAIDSASVGMWDLIGVQFYGIGPLMGARLPLSSGLTVLFGRNGAGKSHALEGLEAALTGTVCRSLPGVDPDGLRLAAAAHRDQHNLDSSKFQSDRFLSGVDLPLPNVEPAVIVELESTDEESHPGLIDVASRFGIEALSASSIEWAHRSISLAWEDPDRYQKLITRIAAREFFLRHSATWQVTAGPRGAGLAIYGGLDDSEYAAILGVAESEVDDAIDQFVRETVDGPPAIDATALEHFERRFAELARHEQLCVVRHVGGSSTYLAASAEHVFSDIATSLHPASGPHPNDLATMIRSRSEAERPAVPAIEIRTTSPLLMWINVISEHSPLPAAALPSSGDEESVYGDAAYQRRVNDILDRLLAGSPQFIGSTPEPRFVTPSGQEIGLGDLSSVQQRWFRIAARLSAVWLHRAPSIVIIDEPERGLHRRAIGSLLAGLNSLRYETGWNDLRIVVASHAPEFIADTRAHRFRLVAQNDETASTIERVGSGGPMDATIAGLGLDPIELLSTRRCFLFVEGRHDEVMLEHLFGPELDAAGVLVIPTHGATKQKQVLASPIAPAFLLSTTGAIQIFLLDKIALDPQLELLDQQVRRLNPEDADQSCDDFARRLNPKPTEEAKVAANLLRTAASNGWLDRVHVVGIEADDIVETVPAHKMIPGCLATWDELKQQAGDKGTSGTKFKVWLKDHKLHPFGYSDDEIRAGCDSYVPSDLERAVKQVLDLVGIHEASRSAG